MKHRRVVAAVAVTLAAGLAVVWLSPRPQPAPRFAAPDDCVAAYADACKDGDATAYLDCLAEPLRSQSRQQAPDAAKLAEQLRASMAEVKSWTQVGPAEVEGATAHVEVDEVRAGGTRRIRFRLERGAAGWRIAGIGAPQDVPAPVRYGTPVGEGP
jgi:hypothetical protein